MFALELPRLEKSQWLFVAFVLFLVALPSTSFAALPWEGPLTQFTNSLKGPVARGLAIVAFVIAGFMLAFGETSGAFSLILRLVFGISLALMAVQWVSFFTSQSP